MKFFDYEPMAGEHILKSCSGAIKIANEQSLPVRFKFNGIVLVARSDSKPETLAEKYHADSDKRFEKYQKTKKYRVQIAKRNAEIKFKEVEIKKLFDRLDLIIKKNFLDKVVSENLKGRLPINTEKNQGELLDWLDKFTPLADDIEIKFDRAALASKLEEAGFIENESVGMNPGWFDTREKMARWILGQVINCLKKGMPPHPIMTSFIEKYRELSV